MADVNVTEEEDLSVSYNGINRRSFLKGAGVALVALGGINVLDGGTVAASVGLTVPHSTGTAPPKIKVPPYATDCHQHIYDPGFPRDPKSFWPGDATVADYRLLQKRLGITRNVLVQPGSTYGVDNSGLVKSLAEFRPANARGVAVVDTGVSDEELKRLHSAGVRGIRLNVSTGAQTIDMVDPLAKRLAVFGWHIQIYALADQILAYKSVWDRVPCPVVFDHLGHVPQPGGASHPVVGYICELLQRGKFWMKLSGPYLDSKVGPPTYADMTEVAKIYVRKAPERLVWGTDWPHPTEHNPFPDDALLLDLMGQWAPNEATRNRIWVDNPAELYDFPR
jgi:predicted TIM-barrel fold metal-dependent hydrolase